MRITESKLRQIIREELQTEVNVPMPNPPPASGIVGLLGKMKDVLEGAGFSVHERSYGAKRPSSHLRMAPWAREYLPFPSYSLVLGGDAAEEDAAWQVLIQAFGAIPEKKPAIGGDGTQDVIKVGRHYIVKFGGRPMEPGAIVKYSARYGFGIVSVPSSRAK